MACHSNARTVSNAEEAAGTLNPLNPAQRSDLIAEEADHNLANIAEKAYLACQTAEKALA